MPTSRRRTPGCPAARHHHGPPGLTGAQQLVLRAVLRADAAEARGDAGAALSEVLARPAAPDGGLLWRPWRVRRLSQLVAFEGRLPRWAVSRWVLDQAAQHLDPGGADHDRLRRALDLAVGTGAEHSLMSGLGEEERQCRIMDRDWVFRQVLLHELGGLQVFLRDRATPDLLSGADDLELWARAPMRACRFLSSTSRTVEWVDLSTGELLELDNIGSAALLVPGDHVLGRVVPTEGGQLFECVPLRVPRSVAVAVADDPGSWLQALRDEAARDEPVITGGQQFGLLHDVHPLAWPAVLAEVGGLAGGLRDGLMGAPVPSPGRPVRDDLAAPDLAGVVLTLARLAGAPDPPAFLDEARRDEDVDGWACVGAALLEPAVLGEVTRGLRPDDVAVFSALADGLPEPARGVCLDIAALLEAAA